MSEGRASGAGVRDRSPCPPLTGREALASSSGPLGDRAAPVARVGAAAGHRGSWDGLRVRGVGTRLLLQPDKSLGEASGE